ncbi:MAG: hypothetical protein Q8N63_05905 [Nanoarchaeota archaeon]|nr:hypothetical protein [Nanoarchaeota archaeon]
MKLQNLLMSAIMGITCLTSQAYASNMQPIQQKIPISAPEKKENPEDNYSINKEAILPPRDKILEEIEIKYK